LVEVAISSENKLEFVKGHLELRWSPEQIAKRLKFLYPNNMQMRVSHETIYAYIYIHPRGMLKRRLVKQLRRKHANRKAHNKEHQNLPTRTIIRGDEKFVAIKLASIVAKVTRDSYMVRLHNRYPEYEFPRHKGYGTSLHRDMIVKYGPSDAHRLTYLKNWVE